MNKTISESEYKRLKHIESLFLFMLENSTDYIYFKDSNFQFTFVSKLLAQSAGFDDWQQLIGKSDFDIYDKEQAKSFRAVDKHVIQGHKISGQEEHHLDNDSKLHWFSTSKIALPKNDGLDGGLFGISRDITIIKELEEKLKQESSYDSLTNLRNRRAFFEHAYPIVELANRQQKELYLFFIDLDGFKPINDEYGHDAGDAVLIQTAKKIETISRSTDISSRYGGDEFIVLSMCNDIDAVSIAERLLSQIMRPISFKGNEFEISCSIGISKMSDNSNLEALIASADEAMYKAKASGKNTTVMFSR